MKKCLAILFIIFLLSGCNSDLSFSEVSLGGGNKEFQSYINDLKNDNGVHLYFDNPQAVYVYLNALNVKQGELAIHFTDFKVEEKGGTLHILYNTEEGADNSKKSVKHQLLYKVNLDKTYDTIKLFSNGEEAAFGVISGK